MKQVKYRDGQNRLVMMRMGKVEDMDRSFDIEFWQSQDDAARFDAAWELVVFAHSLRVKQKMNSDFKDLLRALNEAKARYLVVGGYAVIKHTEPRYTKALDLWVSPDIENAK